MALFRYAIAPSWDNLLIEWYLNVCKLDHKLPILGWPKGNHERATHGTYKARHGTNFIAELAHLMQAVTKAFVSHNGAFKDNPSRRHSYPRNGPLNQLVKK